MIVAPFGVPTSAAGPAAAMRSPRTSTVQPFFGASLVPSQTACGRSSTRLSRDWAEATDARQPSSSRERVIMAVGV